MEEYEEVCPICNNKKYIKNPFCIVCKKENAYDCAEIICQVQREVICKTCKGTGKITWIDKIMRN